MLRTLLIKDYALIDSLEVEFEEGLNILTGETGAGKSIIIGALKMILGERASTEVIRTGARKAVIEGVFDHVEDKGLEAVLQENDLDVQPSIILRREISETQSRAFINDSPANLQLMKTVAGFLIDLHGQHEHQSLLRPEMHLQVLDNFGRLDDAKARYRNDYEAVESLRRKRAELQRRESDLRRQKELIEFQIEEIDRVNPAEGEEEALEHEHRILENSERLFETTARLQQALYESEGAVYDRLVEARGALESLAEIDEKFGTLLEEIRSAEIIVSEAGQFLQEYNSNIEFNPERLEEIRQRLGDIELLKRKYGGSLDAVLEHRRSIGETYDLAADFEGALRRLDEQIASAQKALTGHALQLSRQRAEIAARIEPAIVAELAGLGMPRSRFEVRIDQQDSAEGWIELEVPGGNRKVTAFSDGMDRVEFFISTNPGEELRPLSRVASGGEISRIMLALKTILARNERLPILVFDEIDSGISGGMARRVGESMYGLADSHQIIAITHLPQIASLGHAHYVVEKVVSDGRTRTGIRRVENEERTREVATLLSGADVTSAALESARELMAGRQAEA